MEKAKVTLAGVQETLLLPLWGRASESRKDRPLLVDKEAVRIIDSLDYDFTGIEEKTNPLSREAWIARSLYFDDKISDFLDRNPGGIIINLGCGFDTTYERVQKGKEQWYELDFPEVIDMRLKVLDESYNRTFLPYSVFDSRWYENIETRGSILIMMAGVIYYFDEDQIKELFRTLRNHFGTVSVIFDYSSIKGMEIANRKVIDDTGMDKSAYLKWSIDDIYRLENWDQGITVKEHMKMFHEHRKKFPRGKRLGMWISDALSVMSLAEIELK